MNNNNNSNPHGPSSSGPVPSFPGPRAHTQPERQTFPSKTPNSHLQTEPAPTATAAAATARRKKHKPNERQLREKALAILPESEIYTQLLDVEARVDAALARKKVDIQEALKNPPCIQKTLRILVFNTFSNQNNADSSAPTMGGAVAAQRMPPLCPKFCVF